MNKYYRGIIIQNNDPSHSGRVKIFVPGVNLTQKENWNKQKEEDKFFKVMGKNTNTSITKELLQNQKEKLFWASVLMPTFGMGSAGVYDAKNDIYYIGNDSDYIYQESSKSNELFDKDKSDAEFRRRTSPNNTRGNVQPRNNVLNNSLFCGNRFCLNTGCDDDNDTPSIWRNLNPLEDIGRELPSIYEIEDVDLDDDAESENSSIISINVNVENPTVFVGDQQLTSDSIVFNADCYEPSLTEIQGYSPPLLFQEIDEEATSDYDNLPVNVSINDRDIGEEFQLESETDDEIILKSNSFRVVSPRDNIRSITVNHNRNRFNLNQISILLSLLRTIGNMIRPRSPQGTTRRGGGGGTIYNNVTTQLLPSFQRRDSHIGGANNESRYTVNRGRAPRNDPNNTKGVNLVGDGGQVHKGPMRSSDNSNKWKGIMSIPGVGAHVWVEFLDDNYIYPVVVGAIPAQPDFEGIYEIQ